MKIKYFILGFGVLAGLTYFLRPSQPSILEKVKVKNSAFITKAPVPESNGKLSKTIPYLKGQLPYSVGRVRTDILQFQNLFGKALLSSEEQSRLHDLITNPQNLAHTAVYLQSAEDAETSNERAKTRMAAVDLLTFAMGSPEPKVREAAAENAKNVLSVNWFQKQISPEAKRIILGDQLELFHALNQHFPERAQAFRSSNLSRLQRRLYGFSVSMNERKNENERSL